MDEIHHCDELRTLPDLLAPGLRLLFVGLNPSEYSAREGHYFANPRNRFWPAFNRSSLLPAEMGRECKSEDDRTLLEYGIGFTDVVKRATAQGSSLRVADYRQWAPGLREKILLWRPSLVCFHGLMAYKAYLLHGEGEKAAPKLGLQPVGIYDSSVFVVPNPSPANASYSLDDLTQWYNQAAAVIAKQQSPGRN